MRDDERTALPGGLDREPLAVDEAHSGRERVDPEPAPHEIEERERGDDIDHDAIVGSQQLDRALRDERRAGNRVEHLTVVARRLDQRVDDAGVDRVERCLALVDLVEARRVADDRSRRMTSRADEAPADAGDLGDGLLRHELGPGRAEPDDDDPAATQGATRPWWA